jgi:hypothetical protein
VVKLGMEDWQQLVLRANAMDWTTVALSLVQGAISAFNDFLSRGSIDSLSEAQRREKASSISANVVQSIWRQYFQFFSNILASFGKELSLAQSIVTSLDQNIQILHQIKQNMLRMKSHKERWSLKHLGRSKEKKTKDSSGEQRIKDFFEEICCVDPTLEPDTQGTLHVAAKIFLSLPSHWQQCINSIQDQVVYSVNI